MGMIVPAPCAKCGIPIEPWKDGYHHVAQADIGDQLLALAAADFEESLKTEQGLKHTLEGCIHILETSNTSERRSLNDAGVVHDFHRVMLAAKCYTTLIERALDLEEHLRSLQIEVDPKFKNN